MSSLDEMLRGSIDMHVHFGPDPRFGRRLDAMQTAMHAQEMGLKAIVLKSHDYPSAPLASIIGRVVTNMTIFGAVTLDFECGGINPYTVEASAKMGAKVLWMPTLSSANSRAKASAHIGLSLKGEGISVVDANGELLPKVRDILDIAKEYDMVLATGHTSPAEVFKLVDCAQKIGLANIIVSHPLSSDTMEKILTIEQQQELAKRGAFMEHTFLGMMPTAGRRDPKEEIRAIRDVGAEHCIISSDFGQDFLCPPAEGLRMFIGTLLKCGINETEIALMAKVNPAKLLGIS